MKIRSQCLTILTLTVAMVGGPTTALALGQKESADQAAVESVLSQNWQPDRSAIASHGHEYYQHFWQQYRQASARWWAAYRQGLINDHHGIDRRDQVAVAGFEAGHHDMMAGINRVKANHENWRLASDTQGRQQEQRSGLANQQSQLPTDHQPQTAGPRDQPPTIYHQGATSGESVGNDPVGRLAPADNDPVIDPVEPPSSGKAFIHHLAPLAQQVGKEYDLYPSVILAQAALESDWGRSSLAKAYHNLFGVKATAGTPSVMMPTREADGHGKLHTEQARFRKYQDNREALFDYGNTLSDPLYNGAHRRQAKTYQDATRALDGKYATDSHYSQKLNAIIKGGHLDRFDQIATSRHRPVVRWGKLNTNKAATAAKPAHHHQAAHHHDWAALGILGGAGSFSLWGFFRHLLG